MQRMIENLRIGPYAMRYSQFVPRLYNYCRSLGFTRERMMPSRAFCSDESQGYPVILLAQHFGTFPFDHGRVGDKVAVRVVKPLRKPKTTFAMFEMADQSSKPMENQ